MTAIAASPRSASNSGKWSARGGRPGGAPIAPRRYRRPRMPAVSQPELADAPAGAPVTHCRWCGAELDDRAAHLAGRTRCGRCGVATTDPFPSPVELDAAYATWYRPEAGRFSGP